MRRLKNLTPILVLLLLASCATILPGNDPVLVNGQRDIVAAHHTAMFVFKTERENEAFVLKNSPETHEAIEEARRKFGPAEKSAWAVLEAYRMNRTAENKANFKTALATLQEIVNQAKSYTTALTP